MRDCMIGRAASLIAEQLAGGDVIAILSDDARAVAVCRALAGLAPAARVFMCPADDALPGDTRSSTPANVGKRNFALRSVLTPSRSSQGYGCALVTTAEAACRYHPDPSRFAPPLLSIALGDALDPDELQTRLEAIGYFIDDRVDEPGEMNFRGQVIDIFPAQSERPVRIELQGDTVSLIRCYDPVSQRSEADELTELRLAEAVAYANGEAQLFAYLPEAVVLLDATANRNRDRSLSLLTEETNDSDASVRLVAPQAWEAALALHTLIVLNGDETAAPHFAENARPAIAAARAIRTALSNGELVVVVGPERDVRFLNARLERALKVPIEQVTSWEAARVRPGGSLVTLAATIDRGWRAEGVFVLASRDLLGSRAAATTGVTLPSAFTSIDDIEVGDVVIHEDHGVGAVRGLSVLPKIGEESQGEGIELEYAGGAIRIIPATEADRIWRYGAEPGEVTLDRLDGATWTKRRATIHKAIARTAQEFFKFAQAEAEHSTDPIAPDPIAYERFVAGFPFSETADQERAIKDVRSDLASGKPLDRLVIGDVGYGKTEVALRATALVALAGKQVVIAAPTTVLVRQHYETLKRRFAKLDIAVASLSRISTSAEKKRVIAGLADGSISVVVGTSAVAAKLVAYANLALVIVDEEHRFGAADKAKLRGLAEGRHHLALSATPIPRTLQSALVGLKQVSLIATPPARRQPIRTVLEEFDEARMRAALLLEKKRGGQSFVVVPRIEDMEAVGAMLARIEPSLEVIRAHGDMPAGDLDVAMVRFAQGAGDVLLSTTIIESGLDVPRANTMLVWQADRFGLSQLHQLRGRVGRGSRRGHILLTTPAGHALGERTQKRLRTLQALDHLGAGFLLSARDLDLRGAGELFGDQQTGHIKIVGVALYQHLLEGAVRAARGEVIDRWTPHINFGGVGAIPESWVPDISSRLGLYVRLARLADIYSFDEFRDELRDRFGPPPPEANFVVLLARIRLLAREVGIQRIDAGPEAIAITPRGEHRLQDIPDLEVAGDRYILKESLHDVLARATRVETLLEDLGGYGGT